MKKIVLLALLAAAGVGIYYLYSNYFKTGAMSALVDQITPPTKEIKEFLPQGRDLDTPIKIRDGFTMGVYADLAGEKPRVIAVSPENTIFVSLTSSGRVVALPDSDGDGVADSVVEVLSRLSSPHGIAFDGDYFYVAESGGISRYKIQGTSVSGREELFALPAGGRHFTRTIAIHSGKLYTSVGSSCDTCVEQTDKRAAVLISDLDGKNLTTFARGLRNTVFFDFDREGNLWGSDMGRDFLGDTLPPDELNIIKSGNDYGWPYCYGDKVRDSKFMSGKQTDYCEKTISPVYKYHAHVAPLGTVFVDSPLFPQNEQGNMLVAMHGSWNSTVPVGYKVVELSVDGKRVTGEQDFITGFVTDGKVLGRPVGLAFDKDGYLYISDDKSGLIYIVSRK